jgi:hypothetical protein
MTSLVVGMATSYGAITQSDWLWHQTPNPFGAWGNIRIAAKNPNPDFLLLYNFNFQPPPQPLRLRDRLRGRKLPEPPNYSEIFRHLPPERIAFLLREPPLEEVVHKHRYDYEQASQYCGYISGPDDFAPTPGYMPAIWYVGNPFRDLHELPPPEKVKPCSWITSGINRTENHRRRLNFLRSIVDSNIDCDVFGRGLPSWAQSLGPLQNKWNGMAPYYYNLSIENYAENNWYVSEKLWDSLLSWCLPIYYGGPAADRLLPPGSFLRLPSLDEKGHDFIREVTATPDAWYAAKDAIAEARQIILHELNLVKWMSDFVAERST